MKILGNILKLFLTIQGMIIFHTPPRDVFFIYIGVFPINKINI